MRKTLLFTALAIGLALTSHAQSRRYFDPQFDSVQVTTDLVYGNNFSFNSLRGEVGLTRIDLLMDVYTPPVEDTVQNRPMIIWAHGGSFIAGSKESSDIVYFCREYAKRGFVCASINYRLGYELPIDSVNAVRTVYRALQDGRAAVRFARSKAVEWGIDPNRIFFGGTSAGAFIAANVAYLNLPEEIPSYVDTNERGLLPATNGKFPLDGLEGKSNDIDQPSNIQGIINYCGATRFVSWLDDPASAAVPVISMHGTADGTVPYGTRVINLNDLAPIPPQVPLPIVEVMGSYDIDKHADRMGYTSKFYTWYGADHVPYISFETDSVAAAYMDTLMSFTLKHVYEDFLQLGSAEGFSENEPPCDFNNGVVDPCSAVGIGETLNAAASLVFPNPFGDRIQFNPSLDGQQYTLKSIDGRLLLEGKIAAGSDIITTTLPTGVYVLEMINGKNVTSIKLVK